MNTHPARVVVIALSCMLAPAGRTHQAGVETTWKDLRPAALKQSRITAAAATRGRELLARAVARHGGVDRWQRFTTAEAHLRDEWHPQRIQFNPWPGNNLLLRFQVLLGTFNSRVGLLEGADRGQIWGIQSWRPYKQLRGKEPVFSDDRNISFFLPTYHYFLEFPFRIARAPIVAYVGERSHGGRNYQLVFATWGRPEPHAEHDQYLLWINRESGLIEIAQYTIRDFGPAVEGTMQFSDFREVQGLRLAFRHTVQALDAPSGEFGHRIVIERLVFDAVPREALLPDASLPFMGDEKPSPSSHNGRR